MINQLQSEDNKNNIYYAANNGRLDIIKRLIENGSTITCLVLNGRLEHGSRILEFDLFTESNNIKCLQSEGAKVTCPILDAAAENGHLKLLEWLYNESDVISDNAIWYAAKNGHLELVKWLYEHGGKIGDFAISSAGKNGHYGIVKYLHSRPKKIKIEPPILTSKSEEMKEHIPENNPSCIIL